MSKLYVHIGTHKTGSTAIQVALLEKKSYLEREGFVYLRSEFFPFSDLRENKTFNPQLIVHGKNYLRRKVNRYSSDKIKSFIISSEDLSGDPLLEYRNARIVARYLREITSGLFDDIEVIVYLRRQDSFIESLYTQMIQQGESYSFENFIQKFSTHSFDWQVILGAYIENFGKDHLIVKRYDPVTLINQHSIIHDFGFIIKSNILCNYMANSFPNASYSRQALEIARITNPYLDKFEKRQLRRILQQTNSKRTFERHHFFSPKDRHTFLARYHVSNSLIAKEYFDDPINPLFVLDDLSDDAYQYPGLSIEEVTVVLLKSILQYKRPESYILRFITLIEKRLISYIQKYPKIEKILFKIFVIIQGGRR